MSLRYLECLAGLSVHDLSFHIILKSFKNLTIVTNVDDDNHIDSVNDLVEDINTCSLPLICL